jgi:hypothetical protein
VSSHSAVHWQAVRFWVALMKLYKDCSKKFSGITKPWEKALDFF